MTPVSEEARSATLAKHGRIAANSILGDLVIPEAISGLTKFPINIDGFTPDGSAYFRVGLPDGADVFGQELTADANGRITATITMPSFAEVDKALGRGIVTLSDVTRLDASRHAAEQAIRDQAPGLVPPVGTLICGRCTNIVEDANAPVLSAVVRAKRDLATGKLRSPSEVIITEVDDRSGAGPVFVSYNNGTTWTEVNGSVSQDGLTKTASVPFPSNSRTSLWIKAADRAGNETPVIPLGEIWVEMYTLQSGTTGRSLRMLYTTNTKVLDERSYSAGAVYVVYNTGLVVVEPIEVSSVGNSVSGNTSTTVRTVGAPAPVALPPYTLDYFKARATTVYSTSKTFDLKVAPLSGVIFVNGDATLLNTQVNADFTVIATGSIYDRSTGTSLTAAEQTTGVLFFAGNNIVIEQTGKTYTGVVMALNKVTYKATNSRLLGALVGKTVELNATTGVVIDYDSALPSRDHQLPLSAPLIVPPATPSGGTLVAPSLTSPANGAAVSNPVLLSWAPVASAAGYTIHVAQDAAFTSIITMSNMFGGSATSKQVSLPWSGRTYYWRVRATGSSGAMGPWSETRSMRW